MRSEAAATAAIRLDFTTALTIFAAGVVLALGAVDLFRAPRPPSVAASPFDDLPSGEAAPRSAGGVR